MTEALSFFDILGLMAEPKSQADYFNASYLTNLFRTKISKSQATGSDGTRLPRFEVILEAEAQLIERKVSAGSYSFSRYKERLLLRGHDRKPRQISIPTVRDRLTLRSVCQVLHKFEPKSIGVSPHSLVSSVVKAIRSGDQSSMSFVRLDVRDFFPSISHALLERELRHFKFDPLITSLCLKAAKTPTGTAQHETTKGVPQGLSISGALAAIYMLRLDARQKKGHLAYFRYVDDILIISPTITAHENLAKLGAALKARGLVIHKEGSSGKTEISPVKKGIDFLGYHITQERVSVRDSSFHRMFRNLLKIITDFRYRRDTDRLAFRLNLKITGCIVDGKRRGWMMFFSFTENLSQLSHLDAFVKRQLKRVKFPAVELSGVKRFIKSYHEIRFNLSNTEYIPNFDIFTSAQKASAVSALSGRNIGEVLAMDEEVLATEFSRLISREVHSLEQDVGSVS